MVRGKAVRVPARTRRSQERTADRARAASREAPLVAAAAEVAKLQRDVEEQMREAQRLTEDLRRQNPDMQKGGSTPEEWQRSVSAPGTEAFKQDFAKWESLKKNLMLALEQTESKLSDQLRAREKVDRLNVGRYESAPESYRELVDRYYQSLATPRRPPR